MNFTPLSHTETADYAFGDPRPHPVWTSHKYDPKYSFPGWMIVTFASKAAAAATTTTTGSKRAGGMAACSRLLQFHAAASAAAAAAASMQCGIWLFRIVGKPIPTIVGFTFQTTHTQMTLIEPTPRGNTFIK